MHCHRRHAPITDRAVRNLVLVAPLVTTCRSPDSRRIGPVDRRRTAGTNQHVSSQEVAQIALVLTQDFRGLHRCNGPSTRSEAVLVGNSRRLGPSDWCLNMRNPVEDSTNLGTTLSRWAATAWLAGIPAAVAAFRIYILANGDAQTFLAIINNLNLVPFLLATLYSLVTAPTGALMSPVLVMSHYASKKDFSSIRILPDTIMAFLSPKPILIGYALSVLIGIAFLPWVYFLCTVVLMPFMLILFGMIVDAHLVGSLNYPEVNIDPRKLIQAVRSRARIFFWCYVTWTCLLVMFRAPMWMPIETVEVESERLPSGGYVLSVDDTSLLLLYKDGGLRQIPVGDVKKRLVCPQDSAAMYGLHDPMPSVLQLILGHNGRYAPDECKNKAIRWR